MRSGSGEGAAGWRQLLQQQASESALTSAAGPVAATEASLSDEQRRSLDNLLEDHLVSGSSLKPADERTAHRLDHDMSA